MIVTNRNILPLVTLSFLSILSVECVPKFENGGFIPSSVEFLDKTGKANDQIAMATETESRKEDSVPANQGVHENNEISDRNQEARFGFTNVGSTGSGYGVSPYAPTKIDLGGLLLGAAIGIGSVLIIPKLLYILSGNYGAYARSDEGGILQMMTKLDDILARHGIDTTSCMQRTVCSYSQHAAAAMRAGETEENKISSFDKVVDTITTNQIFNTAMQGTAIQEAIAAGRDGQNCTRSYPHCGFSMETILSLVTKIIASISLANVRNATTSTASAAEL